MKVKDLQLKLLDSIFEFNKDNKCEISNIEIESIKYSSSESDTVIGYNVKIII